MYKYELVFTVNSVGSKRKVWIGVLNTEQTGVKVINKGIANFEFI